MKSNGISAIINVIISIIKISSMGRINKRIPPKIGPIINMKLLNTLFIALTLFNLSFGTIEGMIALKAGKWNAWSILRIVLTERTSQTFVRPKKNKRDNPKVTHAWIASIEIIIYFRFNLSTNTPAIGAIKIWGTIYRTDDKER